MRYIADHYAPIRIIQWASVLRPERFTESSGIDLAVEGIADAQTWSDMDREVERMATVPLNFLIKKLRELSPLLINEPRAINHFLRDLTA